MKWARTLATAVAALPALFLLTGCGGQMYLGTTIERDGEQVLQGGDGVSDGSNADERWESLKRLRLKAVGKITPDADDPSKAVLRGKVKITLTHVRSVMATAEVDTLKLVRVAGTEDRWELAPGEVDRTARLYRR